MVTCLIMHSPAPEKGRFWLNSCNDSTAVDPKAPGKPAAVEACVP